MTFNGFPTVLVAGVVVVLAAVVVVLVIIVAAPSVGFYLTIRRFAIPKSPVLRATCSPPSAFHWLLI
jgi:hypothetical protein